MKNAAIILPESSHTGGEQYFVIEGMTCLSLEDDHALMGDG